MSDFEKLGAFYLGRRYDAETQASGDEPLLPLLYDAKDLTTHGLVVGMTGSGKTGLSVVLLEEAAIDGIPALIIDPKGDMGNLLLSFPKLQPSDFRPWIDESEASRKGVDPDTYAAETATKWQNGLADWGQTRKRIKKFRSSVDLAVYTPGSDAGLSLSLLRSFAAPPVGQAKDSEALRERTLTAVSGLLGLLGLTGEQADPIRGREHILLSKLLEDAWGEGRDMDVASLIRGVQEPPFETMGVMDLESFFPSKDRRELAMLLNNLLASPAFAAWREGEPLDIQRLLYTSEGRPRHSIFSIAHLSESERMFFVSMLLNELIGWMRTQPGTGSLRAILYMDEIFGYFPPTAMPPSKIPMLTLLKQARAYGIGVLLATQNPVDLDYKGLSNTGTWFLGRLQTERDKERVIEGLEGASGGGKFDRRKTERLLAGLGKRVFLMHNVHEDEPTLFQTRWALSYLRGPLTKTQIETLMAKRRKTNAAGEPKPQKEKPGTAHSEPPILPREISRGFLPVRDSAAEASRLVYRPALRATTRLHYVSVRNKIDHWETVSVLLPLSGSKSDLNWDEGTLQQGKQPALQKSGVEGVNFAKLPATAMKAKSYDRWSKSLRNYFYQNRTLTLWKSAELKAVSRVREEQAAFRARLTQALREKRDKEIEKLRKRYAPKLARLQKRIQKAEERVEREKGQYKERKYQTAISFGATLLGALLGRKVTSTGNVGRATTTARSAGRAARERGDISRAEKQVEQLQVELQELEETFEDEVEALRDLPDPAALELEEIPIRPRKSDITVSRLALAWTPWERIDEGVVEPRY